MCAIITRGKIIEVLKMVLAGTITTVVEVLHATPECHPDTVALGASLNWPAALPLDHAEGHVGQLKHLFEGGRRAVPC